MTHSGFSPRATRSISSNELRNAFFQFSQLGPAIWGVRMMWQGEQLVLGCGRLLDHDVEPGPADPVGDQCIMERVLVDHRAAAGIDQDRRRFHQPQLAHPDQFVCRGIQRHVQGDDVRAPQQLGKQRKAHVERVFGIAAEPGDVVILDAHMERLCEARHLLADVAEPDHAERLVLELVEHDRREIVAAQPPGDDIFMLPNQPPRDREHQQQSMLGDRDRVRTAIVADRHGLRAAVFSTRGGVAAFRARHDASEKGRYPPQRIVQHKGR
jgi:hypothetical protein